MDNQRNMCSGQVVALAFLGGAVVGAVAGMLLAPKSGKETRQDIKDFARRTEEEVLEKAREARAALDELLGRGQHLLAENKAELETMVKAGREATKDRIGQCCG